MKNKSNIIENSKKDGTKGKSLRFLDETKSGRTTKSAKIKSNKSIKFNEDKNDVFEYKSEKKISKSKKKSSRKLAIDEEDCCQLI